MESTLEERVAVIPEIFRSWLENAQSTEEDKTKTEVNKDGLQICFARLARIEKCYTIDKESKVTKTKITKKGHFLKGI